MILKIFSPNKELAILTQITATWAEKNDRKFFFKNAENSDYNIDPTFANTTFF
jgi:hypothetical protein